jgi:hypothetical protein
MGAIGSLLKPLVKYGAMIGAVIIGTMTLCSIVVLPLHLNPSMPQFLKTAGAGVPLVCFGVGLMALVFARNMQVIKYTAPVGAVAPAAVYGISLAFSLPGFFLSLTIIEQASAVLLILGGAVLVSDVFTGWISGKKRIGSGSVGEMVTAPVKSLGNVPESVVVGAFQIVENPEERVLPRENEVQRPVWKPAESVLRALLGAGLPLIYRLERVRGTTRECYLTLGRAPEELHGNMSKLERALSANYPRYRTERVPEFQSPIIPPDMHGVVACLIGEPLRADDPQQRGDPLTVVAEAMLRQDNCILQMSALPVAPGLMRSLKRAWLGRKYRSEASRAQVTISHEKKGLFAGKSQESTVYTDMITAQKANRTHRELERQSSRSACNLEISAACWDSDGSSGEHSARLLMEILQGTIIPADPSKYLKTRLLEREESFRRIVEGIPVGEFTQLLPVEVAPLFTLPQTDIETPITKRSSFSTSTEPLPAEGLDVLEIEQVPDPANTLVSMLGDRVDWTDVAKKMDDVILLGNPLRRDGSPITGKFEWFPRQKFESQLGIYGNTRSGKSWTAFMVAAQAMKCGMKATIVVPRRPDDWLPLLQLFEDVLAFTPGDLDCVPFRINMFNPPINVPLELWMETIVQTLSGLLPSDRVMTLHFDDVVHTVYRNCGWSPKSKIRGRPILLSDLWDAVEEVATALPYGNELQANFYGALTSRMKKMLRNHTKNNVILDLQRLPKEDRAFLMGLVAAGLHQYKAFNRTKEMTNLLVLEEASYILKPSKVQDLYGPDASQTLLHLMVDMFTTCGGNGLGTMTIEQLPGRLAPEVVKLIVNVISHAIGDEDERKVVAGHIGVDDARIGHLQQMDVGETLVYLEGAKVPKNIIVWPIDKLLEARLARGTYSPQQIKKHMEPVLQANEHMRGTIDLPTNILNRIERAGPVGVGVPTISQPAESLREHTTYESDEVFYDKRIKEFVCDPIYLESLELKSHTLKEGDVRSFVDMVLMVSEDLAGSNLDQLWVAEKLVSHTGAIYHDLVDDESMRLTHTRLKQLLGKEG